MQDDDDIHTRDTIPAPPSTRPNLPSLKNRRGVAESTEIAKKWGSIAGKSSAAKRAAIKAGVNNG